MSKQPTDMETWEEIAEQVNAVGAEMDVLISLLAENVPKSAWYEEYEDASDGMAALKSALENRMAEEHPDGFDTEVFYGP